MTQKQVHRFFANFGFHPGHEYKPIPLERMSLIATTADRWHGGSFALFVMDCFMPEGEAIAPGYEDSCPLYRFMSDVLNEPA
jgi:hypothetical protein